MLKTTDLGLELLAPNEQQLKSWTKEACPNKAVVRQFTLDEWIVGKIAKCVLLLPSHNLEDFKLLVDLGIVDHNTAFIFVEKKTEILKKMVAELDKFFGNKLLSSTQPVRTGEGGKLSIRVYQDDQGLSWRFAIYDGNLHNLPLNFIQTFANLPKIDLALIDLCCNLTHDLRLWVENELKNYLADDALVSFTVSYWYRAHDYEDVAKVKEKFPDVYQRNFLFANKKSPNREMEAIYKTWFQSWFPNANINRPIFYQDGSYPMMTWRWFANLNKTDVPKIDPPCFAPPAVEFDPPCFVPSPAVEFDPPCFVPLPIKLDVTTQVEDEDAATTQAWDKDEDHFTPQWEEWAPYIKSYLLENTRILRSTGEVSVFNRTAIKPVILLMFHLKGGGCTDYKDMFIEFEKVIEFNPVDCVLVNSKRGTIKRWHKEIQFAVSLLAKENMIEGRGSWELSMKGDRSVEAFMKKIRPKNIAV